jgi:tetratricopeptide (TPR) repeat protein
MTVDPTRLDGYAGRYLVNPDRILTVTSQAGRLYGQPTGETRVELFAISEDTFVRKDADVQYTFSKGESGQIERLRIRNPQNSFDAARVPADRLIPFELLMAGRTAEAEEAYRKIKRETPANVSVQENRLNTLGYTLVNQKKYAEAVVILKLNAELYPTSSNVYDSLGEAYMLNGQKELAIKNYRKSLELDPKNSNAVGKLKELEK